jgi:hypothetical protein
MRSRYIVSVSVVSAAFSLAGQALAADNCSGHYSQVVTTSHTFDLGNGHKIDMFTTKTTADSLDSPYNGTGECTGYVHTLPDGTVRAVGICGRKNSEGTFTDEWSFEPGAERGVWKSAGGTGKYAKMKSSGWWQDVVSEGGVTLGKWGGNCN